MDWVRWTFDDDSLTFLLHRNMTRSTWTRLDLPLLPRRDTLWPIPTFCETFPLIRSCHGFSWEKKSSCRPVCGRLGMTFFLRRRPWSVIFMSVATNPSFGNPSIEPLVRVCTILYRYVPTYMHTYMRWPMLLVSFANSSSLMLHVWHAMMLLYRANFVAAACGTSSSHIK
jgi:hypothetical protein